MKGLIIWTQSYCRSTIGFYIELIKCFGVSAKVFILNNDRLVLREKVGFKEDEICHSVIHRLNNSHEEALHELSKHKDYNHLFASYQNNDICQSLLKYAVENNLRYGVMSEAPCNMESKWYRRILKRIYLNTVLKWRVNGIILHSDFILNYSGYYEDELRRLGWKPQQVISCGYYPPPIPNSILRKRTTANWRNFTILLSGLHQWHRSPMVLLRALRELDKAGTQYKCIITQDGPQLAAMKKYVSRHNMKNVEFLGFVPLNRLIELYETCSIYIGAGNAEPWGMRLNDALQCGAPLVVNRGMGGAKLVDDYKCGLTFNKGDYRQLAIQLKSIIYDEQKYLEISKNAYEAALKITPVAKAREMYEAIKAQTKSYWS